MESSNATMKLVRSRTQYRERWRLGILKTIRVTKVSGLPKLGFPEAGQNTRAKFPDLPLQEMIRPSCGRCTSQTWRKETSLSLKRLGQQEDSEQIGVAKFPPVDKGSSKNYEEMELRHHLECSKF